MGKYMGRDGGLWIKPFQADGQFYIYSGWNNEINRVSPRLYDYFANSGDTLSNRRSQAAALGLLPGQPVPVRIFPKKVVQDALARLRREGPARLVMSVTEACNFRCRYCVFSGTYPYARRHGRRRISQKTAFKALHWYFSFARNDYRIGFYGGEPLLERELIQSVVREARNRVPAGAKLDFSLTTNGWLLSDEAIRFLADNAFDLFISLDGPAPVHDRYRRTIRGGPTFNRIWKRIQRIRQLRPDYLAAKVNFCIMLAPPDRVSAVAGFMEQNPGIFENKTPVALTLEDAPATLYEALGVAAGEARLGLASLRECYISRLARSENPDGLCRALNEAAMARLARRRMTAPETLSISGGQCIPGARCHVTPDGMLHACERLDPCLPIGHVNTGYDEEKIAALLKRFAELVRARCRECWALRLCRKCLADVAEGPHLPVGRLSVICAARRREIEQDLIDYCRARSGNDHCFDYLAADPEYKTAYFKSSNFV
jgi:uncharacterized protein